MQKKKSPHTEEELKQAIKRHQSHVKLGLIAAGVTGLCIAGYFGYKFLHKSSLKNVPAPDFHDEIARRSPSYSNGDANTDATASTSAKHTKSKTKQLPAPSNGNATVSTSAGAAATVSDFPLKKGSRGPLVTQLQQSLNARFGEKLATDGVFGSKTEAALQRHYSVVVADQDVFSKLTENNTAASSASSAATGGAAAIGMKLYGIFRDSSVFASKAFDFDGIALPLLQGLLGKDDYVTASNAFKSMFTSGKAISLLSGMFDRFPLQKTKLTAEFSRMGLHKNGDKWTLSGFGGPGIITIEPTTVWVSKEQGVAVPANMVLGNEIARRMNHCLFENGGRSFLVPEKSIRYL